MWEGLTMLKYFFSKKHLEDFLLINSIVALIMTVEYASEQVAKMF